MLTAVLLAGCATTSQQTAPTVDACSLDDETACVVYGAIAAPSVTTPSGQLVIGLADRAAGLPDEEAVDYWRRIVEVVGSSPQSDSTVNRRAAASYAALSRLALDDVGAEAEVIEEVLSESQDAVEHVRELAEFAVKWGSQQTQARGVRAIADAYARQADTLAAFELPAELTADGRTTLAGKRDGLVRELRAEVELLRGGLAEHCRQHRLEIAECSELGPPVAAPPVRKTDGVCGVRIGMPAATVSRLLGEPVGTTTADECVVHRYDGLNVMLCFDTVREVEQTSRDCP